MQSNETIEDLVDKTINEALQKQEIIDEEVKKRRPKPFRYITDKEEMKAELEKISTISVMKKNDSPRIFDDSKLAILGLGDLQAIENVIRKHEISKQFK